MFSGKMDSHSAFLDIQAGAGGTEAQDWAEMLLRMYLRWAESRGWKTEVMESSGGEVAGIKRRPSVSKAITPTAGCKTETGVHRLVRKSPFDSGNRRHTSFASVFVSPEVDDDIDIEINPGGPADRCLSLVGRGRPARQQDRVGGAHHAHPDQHRGRLPDRAAASTRTATRR